MNQKSLPQVVIVGAGFAGIHAAKSLRRVACRVTVIDKTNHHLFQPLLYQVATGGLSPAEISAPVRAILRKSKNTEVILACVTGIDPVHSTLRLDDGKELDFDYLILAAGARHSYFGNDSWEILAPGLKTVEDALELRRRILSSFEEAERTDDLEERQRLLTFVVIGAGPTGVEMAGAISELARYALSRDFRNINLNQTKIILLEAGDRALQSFSPSLSDTAAAYLKNMHVDLRLGKKVTGLSERAVLLGDQIMPCSTVVWAAGVEASSLGNDLKNLDKAGRVKVQPDLSAPGFPHIFVCGDMAAYTTENGDLIPGQAPGAIQMGRHAANNIKNLIRHKPTTPFVYFDKGSLATIGRYYAIGEAFGLKLKGFLARLIWIFIHIIYLIGFRNRFLVLAQWTWSFFTYRRGARLITDDFLRGLQRKKNVTIQQTK